MSKVSYLKEEVEGIMILLQNIENNPIIIFGEHSLVPHYCTYLIQCNDIKFKMKERLKEIEIELDIFIEVEKMEAVFDI